MAKCYKVTGKDADLTHIMRGGYWTNKNGLDVKWEAGHYKPDDWLLAAQEEHGVSEEDADRMVFLFACMNGKFMTFSDVDVCATELRQLMLAPKNRDLKLPFRIAFPSKSYLPKVS